MNNETYNIAPCEECENTLVSIETINGEPYFPAPCPCGGDADYLRIRTTDTLPDSVWECYEYCSEQNKWQYS